MPMHPEDVVRKSFTTSRLRQGYDTDEVDAFLEEVVLELRRLVTKVDELEAEALARGQRGEDGQESQRLRLERQQLDLIRRERAELVEELRTLQSQVDAGQATGPEGSDPDSRREDLQRQVDDLQQELDQLKHHHHAVRERVAGSLREQLQLLEAEGGPYPASQVSGRP